jgi:hypothetical protein
MLTKKQKYFINLGNSCSNDISTIQQLYNDQVYIISFESFPKQLQKPYPSPFKIFIQDKSLWDLDTTLKWLKDNYTSNDYIIIKINVEEGYKILNKFIDNDIINMVDEFWIDKLDDPHTELSKNIFTYLKENNIKLKEWKN